eukprot:TRINITY_DN5897_c0_g1_i1.p1 TRINITY_DN5897_c0_g1~~TRINITY_DN5897_c0_g1_i1.p1  ORF type:complete len:134 (+),score=36.54 TRINITY_DN5897_c0_g1_i1:3-404(+)
MVPGVPPTAVPTMAPGVPPTAVPTMPPNVPPTLVPTQSPDADSGSMSSSDSSSMGSMSMGSGSMGSGSMNGAGGIDDSSDDSSFNWLWVLIPILVILGLCGAVAFFVIRQRGNTVGLNEFQELMAETKQEGSV